jgi:voltage-gated potassium channel
VHKTNFSYLLVALVFLLVAIPIADDLGQISVPIARAAVFCVLLIVGIWSLKGGGRFFSIGMFFVVTGIALNVIAVTSHTPFFQYSSILAIIGFLLVTISYTLRQIVFGTEVNANRLVGAVCVYLLLGVIWGLTYSIVELAMPGSFDGVTTAQGNGWNSSWLYFSFVTLTTLGYGDILPISATARALAYMQAVVGQFYVAVLVAGLVSGYISNRQNG